MDGLALPCSDLPIELIERCELGRLVHDRGGEREIRFMRQRPRAVLPIRHNGELRIVPWGCRTGKMPATGYTWQHTVEAGEWTNYNAEAIEIPAKAGYHNGVWFRIQTGARGLLAAVGGDEAAYMIVEPTSYYYSIMTKAKRMPVLIGERI
jgi:hypothetical protein